MRQTTRQLNKSREEVQKNSKYRKHKHERWRQEVNTHLCMFAPFFCSYYFSTIISNCRIFDITHRYVETQAVAIHVILPIDVDLRIARRETEAEQWKKLCLLD